MYACRYLIIQYMPVSNVCLYLYNAINMKDVRIVSSLRADSTSKAKPL